jgi:hypothetical protein
VTQADEGPIWLTGGSIALSKLSATPPAGAHWWWEDRIAFVFMRHDAVRFSIDAKACTLIYAPVLEITPEKKQSLQAEKVLRQLLTDNPCYRQVVDSFSSLAALDEEYRFLESLKTEADANLAQEQRSAQLQVAQQRVAEASGPHFNRQSIALTHPPISKASWDDLIVPGELLEKLQTYCDILRHADAFRQRGITIPKGLLFYGPPGTGKTLTARVLAAQSGLAFVGCTTADIKQGWIGHSGQKVKEIFAAARTSAPTILFIDELEAITNDLSGSPDTITSELTAQLLQEIDGIQTILKLYF